MHIKPRNLARVHYTRFRGISPYLTYSWLPCPVLHYLACSVSVSYIPLQYVPYRCVAFRCVSFRYVAALPRLALPAPWRYVAQRYATLLATRYVTRYIHSLHIASRHSLPVTCYTLRYITLRHSLPNTHYPVTRYVTRYSLRYPLLDTRYATLRYVTLLVTLRSGTLAQSTSPVSDRCVDRR